MLEAHARFALGVGKNGLGVEASCLPAPFRAVGSFGVTQNVGNVSQLQASAGGGWEA